MAEPVVIDTCTGAWSRSPVAVGSSGVTSTVMVGLDPLLPLPEGVVATVPTEVTVPGVVCPSGSVIVTVSPVGQLTLLVGVEVNGYHPPRRRTGQDLRSRLGRTPDHGVGTEPGHPHRAGHEHHLAQRQNVPFWVSATAACNFSTPALVHEVKSLGSDATSELVT